MYLITKYVTYKDIDLIDKLNNMLESEISEDIYNKCMKENTFKKIEERVWELITDKNSKFSKLDFYDGLAKEYEAENEQDKWSACMYNCDLLYMIAIANVLGLETPQYSWDVEIFGI